MIEVETRCEFVDLKPWTVGDHQKLVCHWDNPTELKPPFTIKFPQEEHTYTLVILDAVATEKELQADVTGYKPGQHKDMSFDIVSGDVHLRVAPLSWEIQATLKQQGQGQDQQAMQQQQQPVPSYGPFMLPFPSWILWTALVLLLAIVGTAVYSLWRHRKKKQFQKKLEEYLHKGSPHQQTHAALRALVRLMDSEQKSKTEVLAEMNTLLKTYLMGTFALPVDHLPARQIIQKLSQRSQRWSKELKIHFRQMLFDLERLQEQPEQLNTEDLLDLCSRLRQLIDQIQFQRGRS